MISLCGLFEILPPILECVLQRFRMNFRNFFAKYFQIQNSSSNSECVFQRFWMNFQNFIVKYFLILILECVFQICWMNKYFQVYLNSSSQSWRLWMKYYQIFFILSPIVECVFQRFQMNFLGEIFPAAPSSLHNWSWRKLPHW